MGKVRKILLLMTLMIFVCTSSVLAASTSSETETLASIQGKATKLSKQVLDLYKEGKEVQANNLPDVIEFREMMQNNPKLESEYFSSLLAMKAMREGNITVALDGDETRIIEFDDGSFIKVSSETITSSNIKSSDPILRDPPGSVEYGTDDNEWMVMGIYPAAEWHLITDYKYSAYSCSVTDVSATARVNFPAWLVSKEATKVSNTETKGDFVGQDPAGTFSSLLKTKIYMGNPWQVLKTHTNRNY